MSDPINITVSLNVKTCASGHFYAVPQWVSSYRCPLCADRERAGYEDELLRKSDIIIRQDHTIAGLRGALKRRKR